MNLILLIMIIAQPQVLTVHFFYSPDCGHCMDILLEDIPKLQNKHEFIFKKYDINILENYELLENMEEDTKNPGDDLPIVFVGDSVFYGPKETRKKLGSTISALSERYQPDTSDTTKPHVDSLEFEISQVDIYYFYQPGCPECTRVDALLNGLMNSFPDVRIHRFDIFVDSSKVIYEALAENAKVPEVQRLVAPAIFVGDGFLVKEDITLSAVRELIKKNAALNIPLDSLKIKLAEERIMLRFSRFSIYGILAAGLLDGINPCAFATLVFFISYLLFMGKRRRDVILMAIFFIVAVFISYLAIGLGAYNLLKFLVSFSVIAKIVYIGFGVVAIILGVLSLRDFFLARQGRVSEMVLQLPLAIKQRIHKDIKEKTKIGGIIFGSLTAGFFISFLEFACTGQVYLPTITFMISKAGFTLKPISALLAYNIMFIVPLVVIAVLATLFTTKKIAASLERKIPMVKFFTALLFFVLGIVLIILA